MSGIRTNAAAELLGVSPNTLRSWERRFGYPKPRRTPGGHRQYDLAELESLRRALLETHNISSAIELARQRGEGPSSPSRLLDAFDHFDEQLADRIMEESLAVRSVERTVEEVLLPALEQAAGRARALAALAGELDGRGDVVRLEQRPAQRLELGEVVLAVTARGPARLRVPEAPLPAAQRVGAYPQKLCSRVGPDPAHVPSVSGESQKCPAITFHVSATSCGARTPLHRFSVGVRAT